MTAAPPARLIDLTRLVSRVGRGPFTGIDRVERAYADRLMAAPEPVFALVRAAPGHILLDRRGISGLLSRLDGAEPWGKPDALARLHLRQSPARRKAMSDLRRLCLDSAVASGQRALAGLLLRHLPAGTTCLNLGHTNLTRTTFASLRRLPGCRIAVLLHDTIPLDHPQFVAEGVTERFAGLVAEVARNADLVIWTTAAARAAGEPHLARAGRVPPAIVAHLGIRRAEAGSGAIPPRLRSALEGRRYFLCLGTIEPRKNLGFLLDLWESMARDIPGNSLPMLVIAGARGWRSLDLFARLDASPLRGRWLLEENHLPDTAVDALLSGACGLLFPSLAEGFGLPPAEAAARGVPVLCNSLPAIREVLGDYPLYAAQDDPYSWRTNILALAGRNCFEKTSTADVPTWESHFSAVLAHV